MTAHKTFEKRKDIIVHFSTIVIDLNQMLIHDDLLQITILKIEIYDGRKIYRKRKKDSTYSFQQFNYFINGLRALVKWYSYLLVRFHLEPFVN